jgi:hypothetical protein
MKVNTNIRLHFIHLVKSYRLPSKNKLLFWLHLHLIVNVIVLKLLIAGNDGRFLTDKMSTLILNALRVCNSFRFVTTRVSSIAYNCNHPLNCSYSTTHKEYPVKMAAEKLLPQIFKFVDQNVDSYKKLLKEAVAIPSVSCDVKYRDDCIRMVHWMQEKLKEVGASSELRDVGFQTVDGKEYKLPPVLVGSLGNVSTILLNHVSDKSFYFP